MRPPSPSCSHRTTRQEHWFKMRILLALVAAVFATASMGAPMDWVEAGKAAESLENDFSRVRISQTSRPGLGSVAGFDTARAAPPVLKRPPQLGQASGTWQYDAAETSKYSELPPMPDAPRAKTGGPMRGSASGVRPSAPYFSPPKRLEQSGRVATGEQRARNALLRHPAMRQKDWDELLRETQ